MGSIYVTWDGACRERATQTELLSHIWQLAQHSSARLARAPQRSQLLQLMTGEREASAPAIDPIRTFDEELTGSIVLDPCLAPDAQLLYEEIERSRTEKFEIEVGGKDKNEPFCMNMNPSDAQWGLRLPRIGVYGLDFRLFDPRQLYPTADRVSFVFLSSPELPALDGCIAQLENRDQCRDYPNEVIRSADWYLTRPHIHLRYYLEEWMDLLLCWVKYFYLPDLYFARYERYSMYGQMKQVFDEMRDTERADLIRLSFATILQQFEDEADEWTGKLSQMS